MPTYVVTDKTNNQSTEVLLSWNDLQTFLKNNPQYKLELSTPKLVSGVVGISKKTDDGFNDVLKKIKKASGRSNKIAPR